MLIATAGHVDHGKTVLVKALTGVDTDRLPEEKERGLSIDLGFAYQTRADGAMLGFVDVPGHERFIRNMLAGVAAIDHALLIVAADDGPMPQTCEHLAILDLLGVDAGADEHPGGEDGPMTLRVLDPTFEEGAAGFALPPRLAGLEGATVGIISNGKKGTGPFFAHLANLLRTRYAAAEVVLRIKRSYSAPAEPALMEEAAQWSAAISGVGD